MFNTLRKEDFSENQSGFKKLSMLIIKAKGHRTINGFALECKINGDYLADIINSRISTYPDIKLLEIIAENSENRVTLQELKIACGYSLYDDRESIKNISVKRGWVCYVDLGNVLDSVTGGYRPAVVLQNDVGNAHSSTTMIVPITSKKKGKQPTHTPISFESGLFQESDATSEQMRCISKRQLIQKRGYVQKIGECPEWLMKKIGVSIMKEVGIINLSLDEEEVINLIDELNEKNNQKSIVFTNKNHNIEKQRNFSFA